MTTSLECSFCSRSEHEVEMLVAGAGGGHICDQCAAIAVRIMSDAAGGSRIERWMRFFRSLVARGGRTARLELRGSTL